LDSASINLTFEKLLIFIIIIPLPLFFAQTIYGTKGLTAWVSIGIAWAFGSAFTVVIYPLWESRVALLLVGKGIVKVSGNLSIGIAKPLFSRLRIFSQRVLENIPYQNQERKLKLDILAPILYDD